MSVVLSLIFSLVLILAAGLWLPQLLLRRGPLNGFLAFALSVVGGLQVLYLLSLNIFDQGWLFGIFLCWSLLQCGLAFPFRSNWQWKLSWESWDWLSLGVALLIGITLLVEPVLDWDSRSIWFFHGKMIYFDGGLSAQTALADKVYWWSHPNYPKLYSVTMAWFASQAEIWNEYLPKIATFCLYLINLGIVWGVGRSAIQRLFFSFLLLGFGREMIWNGYLDFYLAVYFSMGVYFLALYEKSKSLNFLALAVSLFGLGLNLKDEGGAMLFALALSLILLRWRFVFSLLKTPLFYLTGFLPLTNYIIWTLRKKQWGITGYFDFGSSMMDRALERLMSWEDLSLILYKMLSRNLYGILFFLVFIGLFRYLQKRPWQGFPRWWFACYLSYFLVIFAIYLGTPFNLYSHISTSVDRVVLALNLLLILLGSFMALQGEKCGEKVS